MRKENKHLKKKIESIYHNQSSNKRICELENEVIELNEEKENLLNLIDELKLASQKATNEFKDLSEKLEKENQDKQQKIEEIKILENQLRQKDEVIETFTNGKDNLEALLGTNMKSISHGLGFDKQKSKKDKSGEKKDKAPLIKFVKGPSLENTEVKQKSSKTQKSPKTQNKDKATRSTQSPDRLTPVHKKKAFVAVVSTPVEERYAHEYDDNACFSNRLNRGIERRTDQSNIELHIQWIDISRVESYQKRLAIFTDITSNQTYHIKRRHIPTNLAYLFVLYQAPEVHTPAVNKYVGVLLPRTRQGPYCTGIGSSFGPESHVVPDKQIHIMATEFQ
ncbi:hypothetical protein Taro_020794 [Colocasia esculenta]|uniref:Uncharacterized protein n=1 Tax=Colocasia esculenta TaxID=4460 RepID=A0A843UPL4_COLES|nr:hypothetical protein [Colocasia esculenta]